MNLLLQTTKQDNLLKLKRRFLFVFFPMDNMILLLSLYGPKKENCLAQVVDGFASVWVGEKATQGIESSGRHVC